MLVKLLNRKTAKINLQESDTRAKGKSALQTKVGYILKSRYPRDKIFEEVRIPGEGFVLDFFIPSLLLVVECQGRQHHERVKFFQPTEEDFRQQQQRDERKRAWCALNGFRLVEMCDDDIH